MKKNYINPKVRIINIEVSESILQGSFIEIGGSGTLDAPHKEETLDMWGNENIWK